MANVESAATPAEAPDPNEEFFNKAQKALRELYDNAQAANELYFMMALMAEMRGMQDAGWNTAEEAIRAFDDYQKILEVVTEGSARLRVILAFYMHVAEVRIPVQRGHRFQRKADSNPVIADSR